MKRIAFEERAHWRDDAQQCGFAYHTIDNARYWDERHAYQFSLAEIENDIEDPTNELMAMCYQAVDRISSDPDLMSRMAIDPRYHEAIRYSWQRQDRDLYGRFDFSYDGNGPAKLLEFNADTPTSLFESAVFQWRWLEDMRRQGMLPPEADQFNLIHENLLTAFPHLVGETGVIHFAAFSDNAEDFGTVEYLADCAVQAGLEVVLMDIAHIGVDGDNYFTDDQSRRIETLFKLYPLEDMTREEFGPYLITTPTRIIEPLWKLTLSNKGLMAVLWEMFEGHNNLLPSFFEDDPRAAQLGDHYVSKPLLSREGGNVSIHDSEKQQGGFSIAGPYGEEGYIRQQICYLPQFEQDWTVIGSWIIAGQASGIGIREDDQPITRNTARFVPHFIFDGEMPDQSV